MKERINIKIFSVLAISLILLTGSLETAHAIVINQNNDGTQLVNNILGMGITIVGIPTVTGNNIQFGTFTNGAAEVGFDSGIVLHSGDVSQIAGFNNPFAETRGDQNTGAADDVNTAVGSPGDADLDLLTGATTFDAAVLEFVFQFGDGSSGGDLEFQFAFASEEYINFINSQFNDGFLLEVDGINVGTTTGMAGGGPITVNNINDLMNAGLYVNNVANTNLIPNSNLAIHFDGLTTVITAFIPNLGPGTHSVKFAVADASDPILDAGVFIQAESFQQMNPGIWITKKTIGGDGTFSFTSPQLGDFEITTVDGVGMAHFDDLNPGIYGFAENTPDAPWMFTGASCDNGDDPSAINLAPEEMVVCTFNNEKKVEPLPPIVGGEFVPLDSTALLIAGMSANMGLLAPIVAGIAGAGAYYIKTRMSKE